MILPSDDNSTPEKRPKNRKSDADPLPPEDDAAEDAAPSVWSPEQLWKNLPDLSDDGDDGEGPVLSQAEWREMLQGDLEAAMFELENFPDPECDFDPPDPPDLYTFHAELIKLRHALKASQDKVLQQLGAAKPAAPTLPQALVVQLGILAGELRAMGNEAQAERVLQLIESFS
jgi:hypothetical protein